MLLATMSAQIFEFIESAQSRPEVFSAYTAEALWTDDHTSAQMLSFHLDETVDASSRRKQFIDESASWMKGRFELNQDSHVIDFGCGPGLYTSRFASFGATTTGIDFSSRSIGYARQYAKENNLLVNYHEANYLSFKPSGQFDLVTMIMCDFCALSPAQRRLMLTKFKDMLKPDGAIVLDVYSDVAFANKAEAFSCEKNQLNGFWSKDPYYAFVAKFKYERERVSLDKYTIVEKNRVREVYNWLQHFTPETLTLETTAAGLEVEELLGNVAGDCYNSGASEFAVVIKHSSKN